MAKSRLKRWFFFNLFVFFVEINLFHSYEHQQSLARLNQTSASLISSSSASLLSDSGGKNNNNDSNIKHNEAALVLAAATNRMHQVQQMLFTNNNDVSRTDTTNQSDQLMATTASRDSDEGLSILHVTLVSVIFLAIIIATLIGNTLVILAVVIVRKLHTQDNANNFLIVSLAVSDLLVGVFAMPFAFYVELSAGNKWNLGPYLCDLYIVSDVLLCTASILNLCAISVDRYFIILHAFVYTQRRNAKLMLSMILVVWLLSGLISIPPLLGWGKPSARLELDQTCAYSPDLKYQIYATLCAFYLPLGVMIIIYINIYRAAKKIRRREMETAGHLSAQPSTLLIVNGSAFGNPNPSEPLMGKSKRSVSSTGSLQPNNNSATLRSIRNESESGHELGNHTFLSSDKQVSVIEAGAVKKISHSDSDQNSIESKLYHSSTSSQDSHNNNHHHHHHHHSPNQLHPGESSLHPPTSTHLMPCGQHQRQNSTSRKFGRRLTQAFAGLHAAAVAATGHHPRHSGTSIAHGKNQKATKTLGVIMGCFILCWLPFFILAIVRPFPLSYGGVVGDKIPRWLDSLLLWLGYFNSALNPMIYARYNREFRRPFLEILCFRCRGINEKLRDEERRKMYMDAASFHHSSFFQQQRNSASGQPLTANTAAVLSSLAYSSTAASTVPATYARRSINREVLSEEEATAATPVVVVSSDSATAAAATAGVATTTNDESKTNDDQESTEAVSEAARAAEERKKQIEIERTRFYTGTDRLLNQAKESLDMVESDLHGFVERVRISCASFQHRSSNDDTLKAAQSFEVEELICQGRESLQHAPYESSEAAAVAEQLVQNSNSFTLSHQSSDFHTPQPDTPLNDFYSVDGEISTEHQQQAHLEAEEELVNGGGGGGDLLNVEAEVGLAKVSTKSSLSSTNYDSTNSIFAQIDQSISSIAAANFRNQHMSASAKQMRSRPEAAQAGSSTHSSPIVGTAGAAAVATAGVIKKPRVLPTKAPSKSIASSDLSFHSFRTAPTSPLIGSRADDASSSQSRDTNLMDAFNDADSAQVSNGFEY